MSDRKAIDFLQIPGFDPQYTTDFGKAYCGDARAILPAIPSSTINLVLTSPPFALRKKKSYGNVTASEYIDWFMPFADQIRRVLKDDGSFVLDIGGSWNKGTPTRSLYHFELLLELCRGDNSFHLAQEFYWYNPAKMPAPAEWVTIKRIRVKDAVQPIWWLSKTTQPKANNRWVLTPYKKSMKGLMSKGYNSGPRPSGHVVSEEWAKDNGGAIPPNLIEASNTRSTDDYIVGCRAAGLEIHPARFPERVPEFFINFLTRPGDVVLDPFAGSNVVGCIAENHKRNWITAEINPEYVKGSRFRFLHNKNVITNE